MKLDAKEILKPALLLFVICVCITALLAGTNKLTAAKIAQNAVENEEASRQTVLPDADEFKTEDDCAVGYKDGEVIGYVYVTSAKGYGGDVQIMTGITTDGTISGVVVLDHDETPGLGANCEKESFLLCNICRAFPPTDLLLSKIRQQARAKLKRSRVLPFPAAP